MRSNCITLITAIVALSWLVGCCPATFTEVPELRGRVIDTSGRPVAGANVHVSKLEGYGGYDLDDLLKTDSAGQFRRIEQSKWGLYVVPMDPFGSRFQAEANADGRRSVIREIVYPWMKVRCFGIGSTHVVDLGDLTVE